VRNGPDHRQAPQRLLWRNGRGRTRELKLRSLSAAAAALPNFYLETMLSKDLLPGKGRC
jgi:environmental stress-induced protein Ves